MREYVCVIIRVLYWVKMRKTDILKYTSLSWTPTILYYFLYLLRVTEDYFYKAMLIPEFCQVYLKCLEVSIKKRRLFFTKDWAVSIVGRNFPFLQVHIYFFISVFTISSESFFAWFSYLNPPKKSLLVILAASGPRIILKINSIKGSTCLHW